MKAVMMEGPRKSRVIDVEIPKPKAGELLVKLVYTGMCRSEWYPWSTAAAGLRLGHEPMGVVAEVGEGVAGFRVGDRVTGLGPGYAEYGVMNAAHTVHVPDALADEDAVAEPLGCLLSGAARVPLQTPGDPVAVVGAGYMGLGMISLLKMRGAGRIVAVDPRPEARENALRYGATEVLSPEEVPDEYQVIVAKFERIFEKGFATVVEFAGEQEALTLAAKMVCAHGTLCLGGYHNDCDRTVDVKLLNIKALNICNIHERRVDYLTHCCRNALELLAAGTWDFKGLTSNIYTMEEFDRAFTDMDEKPPKFVKALVRCAL